MGGVVNVEAIPLELRERSQWVVWRFETRGGKPTKVPYRANRPRVRASTTDPRTWGRFEHAVSVLESGRADGVGFVFALDDGLTGVDLDACRNPETGELTGFERGIVDALNSYTEISPSRTGVHVLVHGRWHAERNRKGSLEVYDHARFFAMTGKRVPGLPFSPMPRQEQLDALGAWLFRPPPRPTVVPGTLSNVYVAPPVGGDDEELIERACAARNGLVFARLWSGDWTGYQSQSEADAALCRHLAYWTGGDVARVDALFRSSGLYRAKWERPDYRERTLALVAG